MFLCIEFLIFIVFRFHLDCIVLMAKEGAIHVILFFLFFCHSKVKHIVLIVFLFFCLASWECTILFQVLQKDVENTNTAKSEVGFHIWGTQQAYIILSSLSRREVCLCWAPWKVLWERSPTYRYGEQGTSRCDGGTVLVEEVALLETSSWAQLLLWLILLRRTC